MIKRLLPVLLLLCFGISTQATITVVEAGSAGTNGSAPNNITTGTYNQPANDCIVAIVNANNYTLQTPSDTQMNVYTNVIAQYVGANNDDIAVWIAYNVAANAANAITEHLAFTPSYAGLHYYDVSLGGTNCTSTALDLAVAGSTSASGTTVSQTITTTSANEAILTAVFNSAANLTAATAPASYTKGAIDAGKYAVVAYQVVTSIQTGVTLTWTSLASSTTYDILCISLKGPGGGGGVVRRRGAVIQ